MEGRDGGAATPAATHCWSTRWPRRTGALMAELATGVEAYERLVAAAAGYVAEDGRTALHGPAVNRLAEATDMLRAFARGLSEVRTIVPPPPA
jgi:hypothetical protein